MSFRDIPDQNRVKKILQGAITNRKVANAYLFICQDKALVRLVAIAFAKALNCEKQANDSCNECLPCRKIAKEIHPDVIFVSPDGESIKIDQVRELRAFTRYGPSEGSWKVVIVEGADKMKIEAANSFLKTLEEPPRHVVFVLLTSNKEGIPKTLVSRCQRIIFGENQISDKGRRDENDLFLNMVDSIAEEEIVKILAKSFVLSKESEVIEDVLNKLIWKQREKAINENKDKYSQHDLERIKIILNTLKSIKRNANKRLALDNMFLKLREVEYGKEVSN